METTWDKQSYFFGGQKVPVCLMIGSFGAGWRGQSMEQEGDTPDLRTVEHVSFQYSFTED